jgi:TatD DNase family protein
MFPKYFDAHSHINFSDYGADQEAVLTRMKENDVWAIAVGTDLKTSKECVNLAGRHGEVFACVGVHPVDDKEQVFDELEFEKLVTHSKVVAIGECGLDYFRIDPNDEKDKKRQLDLFQTQIKFALKHDLPLMIHSRSAYDELIDILSIYKEQNSKLCGNIHFFSGNLEQAKKFVDLGFTISFAGPITFARDYDEVIKNIPISSILAETDSPFATPAPYRGKRNEPTYVIEVVKKIAEVRGEDLDFVGKTLVENTLRTFGIKF